MKMALHDIDEQIREVENRIAVERIALDGAVHDCVDSLRETVTSPKTLLALLGVGFTVGKILFREKPEPQAKPAKKAGFLGILGGLAGTAVSIATARSGWGGVARWAAGRYFSRRKEGAGNTPPRPASPAATTRAISTPVTHGRTPAGL